MSKKSELKASDAQKFNITTDKKKKKVDDPNALDVIALDGDSGNWRFLSDFEAERWVEPGTSAVYIKNDKLNFMIPYPEREEINTNLSIGTIADKMKSLEDDLKDELENDTEEINEKDLIDEYVQLKNKLRTLLFSSSTSTWGSKTGRPCIIVYRKGSKWFPLSVDGDTSTIHTISNARQTDTRNLESNKRLKYGALSNLTTLGLIFIICSFMMFGLGTYTWYKAHQVQSEVYEASTYMELVRECKEGIVGTSEDIKKGVIDGVSESLVKHQTENDPKGSGGQ